jgi:hypothetical protein
MNFRPRLLTARRRGISPYGAWRIPGPTGAVISRRETSGRRAQLTREIAKFLYSGEDIAKIDFYLGISEKRIHITGRKIAEIGTRLETGELTLEMVDANVPKDAGAAYSRKGRKFLFRSWIAFSEEEKEEMPESMAQAVGNSLFRDDSITCGLVVHEAVHSVLGLEGRAIVQLSDEAAAYLAETLFHVYRDTYDFYLSHAKGEWHRQIIETARELIADHQLDSKPGRHLNWLQYRRLRKVIHAHPLYSHLGPIERYD